MLIRGQYDTMAQSWRTLTHARHVTITHSTSCNETQNAVRRQPTKILHGVGRLQPCRILLQRVQQWQQLQELSAERDHEVCGVSILVGCFHHAGHGLETAGQHMFDICEPCDPILSTCRSGQPLLAELSMHCLIVTGVLG